MENWRPIPGWEGYYEASDQGGIRSVERVVMMGNRWGAIAPRALKSKLLRPCIRPAGYQIVGLNNHGRCEKLLVHRLIAITFLGDMGNALDVAHNDGNPSNNRLENLRWATRQENMADTLAHGTRQRGEHHKSAKLTDAQVAEIRASRHVHAGELAERYGVHRVYVYQLWRGERRA